MTTLLWFRRDLRLRDHPALAAAAAAGGDVLPVFVLDPRLLAGGAARTHRLHASLAALHEATGGALVLRHGDPAEAIPALAAEVDASEVHVTGETTPYGRRRDQHVADHLASQGRRLVATGTPYAVTPGRVRTGGGRPYRVFTPYARAWREHGWRAPAQVPTAPAWHRGADTEPLPVASNRSRDTGVDAGVDAGEEAALARWHAFLADDLWSYDTARDRPDLDTTSRMSIHLKFGEIHPRTMLADL
ncbi:MAG: deoxyribodipyrimidine photo-lyase, partial [Dermatophilaceae bacterium]